VKNQLKEIRPQKELQEKEVDTGFDPQFEGHMPKRIGISILKLIPKEAERFLSHNAFRSQRKIMDRRMEELKRKVKDGRYHGGEIAMAEMAKDYPGGGYLGSDGKTHYEVMVNGQHTCRLVIDTEKPQEVTLKRFLVHTPDELTCLWGQFDAPGGNRTANQVAKTYQEHLPWDVHAINLISSALSDDLGKNNLTKDEKIDLIFEPENRPSAQLANTILFENVSREHKFMRRQGVAQAIIACHKEDSDFEGELAQDFWNSVKMGERLSSGDPAFTLRNWLQSVVLGNTRRGGDKDVVATFQVYTASMYAWRKHVNNEKCYRLQYNETKPRERKLVLPIVSKNP